MTYTTLTAARSEPDSIRNWGNSTAIPAEAILRDAQLELMTRGLRVREMLTRDTGTLAEDDDTIALSTLSRVYRQPYFFMFTGVNKFIPPKKTLDFVLSSFSYDQNSNRVKGRPRYYAADAVNIQFDHPALQNYPWLFQYFGDPPALASGTQEENMLTQKYPRLLRLACLVFVAEWKKDQKDKLYYVGLMKDAIDQANADADLELATAEIDMMLEGGSSGLQAFGNI